MSKNGRRHDQINRWRVIDNTVRSGWGPTLRLTLLLLAVSTAPTALICALLR